MVQLINTAWGIDQKGTPIKLPIYLASVGERLPAEAPIGSKALFDDGSTATKTPSGWEKG